MIHVTIEFSAGFKDKLLFFHQFGAILEGFLSYQVSEGKDKIILKGIDASLLATGPTTGQYLHLILKLPESSYSKVSALELSSQICQLARSEAKDFFKESEVIISCEIDVFKNYSDG